MGPAERDLWGATPSGAGEGHCGAGDTGLEAEMLGRRFKVREGRRGRGAGDAQEHGSRGAWWGAEREQGQGPAGVQGTRRIWGTGMGTGVGVGCTGGCGTCTGGAVSEPLPPDPRELRPRHCRRSRGPRSHVTRAGAGGEGQSPGRPGVRVHPSAHVQRLPWRPRKRWAANDAGASAGGEGKPFWSSWGRRYPTKRGCPLLRGVRCFRNKHAPRSLGAHGGRGRETGLHAGTGCGAWRGGVCG